MRIFKAKIQKIKSVLNTPSSVLPDISPARQLFYLTLICIASLMVGGLGVSKWLSIFYHFDIITEMSSNSATHPPGYLNAFRIFLALGNTVIGFLAPALVFAFSTVKQPDEYLHYRDKFPLFLLVLVVAFMVVFMPVIDISAYYNQHLSLPGPFKALERAIRESDKTNESMVKQVLATKSISDLLIGILIIAALPAIAEEFLFRGCMQSIFQRWGMSTHAAVWISAFIFSFIHFAFLGFVPRMLLGAALGYFFVYSGSIWPSVLAHFLNNAFAVVSYYLIENKIIKVGADKDAPMVSQLWVCLICLVVSVLIMRFYQRYAEKKKEDYGEELD